LAPSPGPAAFLVKNKLILPIRIFINDRYSGEVEAQAEQVFHLDRDPVQVRWEIVKETTAEGKPLGHDMGATFSSIARGAVVTVNNIVGDQAYFYPFISNHTDKDCEVTINLGWQSENVTKAVVPAGKDDVGLGYFRLYTNSNVTLNCDGSIRWWGLRPGEQSDTSFFDKVDPETGTIYFTLEP
jgi:hypothetical protein